MAPPVLVTGMMGNVCGGDRLVGAPHVAVFSLPSGLAPSVAPPPAVPLGRIRNGLEPRVHVTDTSALPGGVDCSDFNKGLRSSVGLSAFCEHEEVGVLFSVSCCLRGEGLPSHTATYEFLGLLLPRLISTLLERLMNFICGFDFLTGVSSVLDSLLLVWLFPESPSLVALLALLALLLAVGGLWFWSRIMTRALLLGLGWFTYDTDNP